MSQHPEAKKRLPMARPAAWSAPSTVAKENYEAASDGLDPDACVTTEVLCELVREKLKTIYDPEIPLNIYDLGLIYGIDVGDGGEVIVTMTLTAPACPVAGSLVQQVAEQAAQVPGVSRAFAKVVWDPPWSKERMSEAAQLELGLL